MTYLGIYPVQIYIYFFLQSKNILTWHRYVAIHLFSRSYLSALFSVSISPSHISVAKAKMNISTVLIAELISYSGNLKADWRLKNSTALPSNKGFSVLTWTLLSSVVELHTLFRHISVRFVSVVCCLVLIELYVVLGQVQALCWFHLEAHVVSLYHDSVFLKGVFVIQAL